MAEVSTRTDTKGRKQPTKRLTKANLHVVGADDKPDSAALQKIVLLLVDRNAAELTRLGGRGKATAVLKVTFADSDELIEMHSKI